ncbi:thiosulfate sulfurtransferase [Lingula anatina]|uniref:Thiosulfate sulfurtransferase n=1 Tax=Lingula anatina TaxID=7574 RepID=A0A1S3KDS0_LINAN|nr:thiosulfate sulfurtransferase [Lingula anatina]|eukprot:XP_013420773.1 thiosulfate sulfurtransferase [Lingula anatina]
MALPTLITTEWLQNNLTKIQEEDSKEFRLLDVSWSSDKNTRADYYKEHIPGSLYFDLMYGVENTPHFPRNLPSAEAFQEQARILGIDDDTHVIVYDNNVGGKHGFYVACRVWWMFKIFGHDKVSVLDGGLTKWKKDNHATTADVMNVKRGNFSVKQRPELLRSFDDIKSIISTKKEQLGDSRPRGQYLNTSGGSYVGGYIPGSFNIPMDDLIDQESHTFKKKEELLRLLQESGTKLDQPLVASCNTGMTACSLLMAAHICGMNDLAVYMGSWTEWRSKADPDYIIKPKTQAD